MYAYFHSIFSFKDILMSGNGLAFINSIFKFIDLKLILFVLICLLFIILIFKTKSKELFSFKLKQLLVILFIIVVLFGLRFFVVKKITGINDGWDSRAVISTDSNYYTNWIEPTRIIRICGSYEYYLKDFYNSFLKKDNVFEAKQQVKKYIEKNSNKKTDNKYNGVFKDKNLVFVMMESEDDWMVNEKVTPTMYEMMHHGFNFVNHYSPGYVTGDTANTEFIANTGIYPSINKLSPNYAYVNNTYPYSIANIFKNNGYTVNSFHRSNGFIYNRANMHISLGYEKYYNYSEMGISDENIDLDRYIIKNGYKYIVSSDKFMSFIITYSPHDPYSYDKIECSLNIDEIKKLYPNVTNEEELCSYSSSRETDNMFKLLLENLKKNDLLEDTIIVAFSDHRNKDISLNGEDEKLNKTVFFIYDYSMKENKIDTITSSVDILPTVLNVFGIDSKYVYAGNDALNNKDGYVIFKDYTYYDGKDVKPLSKDLYEVVNYSSNLLISDYYKE